MNNMQINFFGFMCGLYWTHDTYFRHYRKTALAAMESAPPEQKESIQNAWQFGWNSGYSKAGHRPTEERFPMPTLTVEQISIAYNE